jgi:hypothetical protein
MVLECVIDGGTNIRHDVIRATVGFDGIPDGDEHLRDVTFGPL